MIEPKTSTLPHILILAQRVPYPPNKGEKLRTYYQIRWLRAQGYQITVAVPTTNDQDQQDLQKLQEHLGINTLSRALGPRMLRLAKGFICGKSLSEANFYSPALHEAVKQLIDQQDISLLMLSASSLYRYGAESNIPVVMDFMDLDSDKWLQYSQKASVLMAWLYQREARKVQHLEQQALREFFACFLISSAEIDQLKQHHPNKSLENVHILGNGIDTQAFYPSSISAHEPNSCNTFLFVGVMDYEPNVEAVLWFAQEVWPKVLQNNPKAQFIIAGMNPAPSVMALKKRTGIQVTGFVEDILSYFHQADVFVAPFQMARGVQNKILQAFACGLPTISTQVGIEGIEGVDGVHYLQANTPEAFLSAIQALTEDHEKRRQLGEQAETLIVERFSWEAKLKTLGQVMEKAITCAPK